MDAEIRVTRVHGTSEQEAVRGVQLFNRSDLLLGPHEAGGPRPEVVVAENLPDRSVATGDSTDDFVGRLPALASASMLARPEESHQAGVLQELHLSPRSGIGSVTFDGIGGKDIGNLLSPRDPLHTIPGRGAPCQRSARSVVTEFVIVTVLTSQDG